MMDRTRLPDNPKVRPEPADTDPSGGLDGMLGLFDELTAIAASSEVLFRGIEQVSGLRVGEIAALRAVASGIGDVSGVARRIGQADDAAAATVAGLIRRGLLRWHPDRSALPDPPARTLGLTDAGVASLEQTEGMLLRLIGVLGGEISERDHHAFRTTLQAAARVLRDVGTLAHHR